MKMLLDQAKRVRERPDDLLDVLREVRDEAWKQGYREASESLMRVAMATDNRIRDILDSSVGDPISDTTH